MNLFIKPIRAGCCFVVVGCVWLKQVQLLDAGGSLPLPFHLHHHHPLISAFTLLFSSAPFLVWLCPCWIYFLNKPLLHTNRNSESSFSWLFSFASSDSQSPKCILCACLSFIYPWTLQIERKKENFSWDRVMRKEELMASCKSQLFCILPIGHSQGLLQEPLKSLTGH